MKNTPSKGAVAALLFSSIFTRLFWGMAADAPAVHAAAWLCPIAGLALCLPIGLIALRMFPASNETPWAQLEHSCPAAVTKVAAVLIATAFLVDCAASMRTLAGTANLISMDKIPLFFLLLPLGLLSAVSILLGMEAAGNCARLWNRLLPLLTAIVLVVHLRSYNPSWLTPVLGSGGKSILQGGVYCGSGIALLSLQWMLATPTGGRGKPWVSILIAVLAASLQLAALQMLSPSSTALQLSRSSRMQLVLSNGRTALPLQMLLVLLCYGGFLQLITAEATACAAFLSHVLPKAPRWSFAAAASLIAVTIASLPFAVIDRYTGIFTRFFPLIGILALLLLIISTAGRRKEQCAKPA